MNKGGLKGILDNVITMVSDEVGPEIFGHLMNPTGCRSCTKILPKNLIDEKVASWYLTDINDYDSRMKALKEKERLNKVESLKCRGKGAPKKGQGKQANKRKK